MAPVRLLSRVGAPLLLISAITIPLVVLDDPLLKRAAALTSACLILWITELIPLYATTLILISGAVLLLAPLDPNRFGFGSVLSWSAQPVMGLFFGGFALSIAGSKYGIDAYIASWLLRLSSGSRPALLATIMAGTAVLSMWMSNVAAAAMMVASLRPLLDAPGGAGPADRGSFRTALLLGVAFAADFGGIGTPLGTGPNLIAIGALAERGFRITFLQWMSFAVPLCLLMLGIAYGLLLMLHRVGGRVALTSIPTVPLTRRGWIVVVIFFVAMIAWLSEPLHGIPSAVVALALAAVLFGSGLLVKSDLARLEWETLMLIAGGLTLGELFSESGLAQTMATAVDWARLPTVVLLLTFITACALLSAVASNTAAAAVLIQIGLTIVPTSAFAVLVALSASMGVPFVISTPPNAMIYGQGGIRPRDVALPGLILMIVGCVFLATTGPLILRLVGLY